MTTTNNGKSPPLLHLVRHARSAYVHHGRWMDIKGVQKFEDDYNAAGIRDDSLPPAELMETASSADVIAASDMLRAILSAKRLAPAREPAVSPLLREILIDPPRWIPFRVPIHTWDWLNYTRLSYRLLVNANHDDIRRADNAVDWLREHTHASAKVVAITHGGFRRILDARLIARGWRRARGPKSYANWSTWSYTPG
jgi:broad specificity phosphatase PhoE